jgi:hypothetical protein
MGLNVRKNKPTHVTILSTFFRILIFPANTDQIPALFYLRCQPRMTIANTDEKPSGDKTSGSCRKVFEV